MAKVFKMSEEEYAELAEDNGGICLACGKTVFGGVEPDAENYECDSCGEMKVFGVEQALIMGRIEFKES